MGTSTTISLLWQYASVWLEPLVTFIAAVVAGVFAFYQWKINKRMSQLEDFVALSVVPLKAGTSDIKVMNVGKINLYLKHYIIGGNTETFENPLLIPAGTGQSSNLKITLRILSPNMSMKFYLFDQSGEKHISSGQIMVQNVNVSIPVQPITPMGTTTPSTFTPTPTVATLLLQIWTFKTEKYNWII